MVVTRNDPWTSADASILWSRLDRPGHESARLIQSAGSWHLTGSAVFAEKGQPVRLDYLIICDAAWKTQSAIVAGWIGNREIAIEIVVTPDARWLLNNEPVPSVRGCLDIDLNFSPSTNLLPVRRLNLPVGHEAALRAAWLRFPSFELEALEQVYRRVSSRTFIYESGGGRFTAQLDVNDVGFPTNYAGLWRAEASA